jgi:hypothetical protein
LRAPGRRRGPWNALENTLESLAEAVTLGVDAVEFVARALRGSGTVIRVWTINDPAYALGL